jgi:histidinol-phosphatase
MRGDRSLDADLELAIRLSEAASEIALAHLRRGVRAAPKADGSPVTEADLAVERRLLEMLASERPDDGVLGEETGIHGASARRWVLDPIDGTCNYVEGRPQWGTHVALEHEGEVVLGVITRPALGRRWWAARGRGAFRSEAAAPGAPVRLRVSTVDDLRRSRVSLWTRAPNEALERAAIRVAPDLDDILRLLEGALEAVVDVAGKPWDHAPAVVLVEEAGGRFEDRLGGRRIDIGEGRYTNGRVAESLRRVLDG